MKHRQHGHVVVTGAAGFLGSHLCRALLERGERVTGIDNLTTGRLENLDDVVEHPAFNLVQTNVSESITVESPVGAVVHLASPGSPVAFMNMPIETLKAGSAGTFNALELAKADKARFLLASSSEVYGDPLVHPQQESYRGNVDPTGPRSVYDEAKRFSEAATAAYRRYFDLDTAIIRPFNVYGPGMWPDDGRVIAAFCAATLRGEPLQLHGDGRQSRSFCYVEDFITGLLAVLDSGEPGPFNIGSEDEITMRRLAEQIIQAAGGGEIKLLPSREQDVSVRRPDITRARELLGWEPRTPLEKGIDRTIEWMRPKLQGV